LFEKSGLTKTFSRQILNVVPPTINKISLKNGERLMAVAGASKIAEYHSAFEAYY
jgi:hypothetical protein